MTKLLAVGYSPDAAPKWKKNEAKKKFPFSHFRPVENSEVTTAFSKCISNKSALASFRSNKMEFSNTWLRDSQGA